MGSRRGFNRAGFMVARFVGFDHLDHLDGAGNLLAGDALHGQGRSSQFFRLTGRRIGSRGLRLGSRLFRFDRGVFTGLLVQTVAADKSCSQP